MAPTIPKCRAVSTTLQSAPQSAASVVRSKDLDITDLAVHARNLHLATVAPRPTRDERTGTYLFMAHKLLLEEGQRGKIKHVYAHDAESFIWVLVWVCLHYDAGVLRKSESRPLDGWLKEDALRCFGKKESLVYFHDVQVTGHYYGELTPSRGHKKSWLVAKGGLGALKQQCLAKFGPTPPSSDETCDGQFQRLLKGPFNAVCTSEEEMKSDDNQVEKETKSDI